MSKNFRKLLDKSETLHDIISTSAFPIDINENEKDYLTDKQAARIGRELINYLKSTNNNWFIINISAPGWEFIREMPTEEHRIDLTMLPLDFEDKEKVFDSLKGEKKWVNSVK